MMGEMADFELENVMDEWEAFLDYRAGLMTDQEAYERGIINELGGEIGTEARQPRKET